MYKHDFLGRELEVGDKVVWANRAPLGNKELIGAYYIGQITKLCQKQAWILEDSGKVTKVFYHLLIKIEET